MNNQLSSALNLLNKEQHQAVTYTNGSLLVLAGAGSGKTKVLTTRLAWLINTEGLSFNQVMAVTFTNKAAAEMLNRINELLGINPRLMWVGTFHSLALRLLRLNIAETPLKPNFQVLDMSEQVTVIKRIIKALGLNEEEAPAREVQKFINSQKEAMCRSSQITDNVKTSIKNIALLRKIYAQYENYCQQENLVDFTELLLLSYEVLANNPRLLSFYQIQFRHILVDEFQDTNLLQYNWLKLFLTQENYIFAVGDDDQSIYSFRGANSANMQNILRDFKIATPIRLEQNYRSTPVILQAANAIIDNNLNRIGKNLWTNNQAQNKILLYEAYSEEEEARFIIDTIQELVPKTNANYSQYAILYRSNAQSRIFEHYCYQKKIPYRVYGGLRFFDRQEIKHILAYLRLVLNFRDNEAFLRVVNFPPRKIGSKSLEDLTALANNKSCSLFEAIIETESRAKSNLLQFYELINTLTRETKNLSLAASINLIISKAQIKEHYQTEKDGIERIENLNQLIIAVNQSKLEEEENPISEFLAISALESTEHHATTEDSAIQLMTVHAAKGLEFNNVFIVGLEEGLFPHNSSLNFDKQLEEERRLMYVAITRAREKLFLTRAHSRMLWGKREFKVSSRFINEIPQNLITNLSKASTIGYQSQPKQETNYLTQDKYKTIKHTAHQQEQEVGLEIGSRVLHPKFGHGKVLTLNGTLAQVFFVGIGPKTLNLNFAKLEKL